MLNLPFSYSRIPVAEFHQTDAAFPTPVCFYLRHAEDAEFALPAIGLARLSEGVVEYFDLYSRSNKEALSNLQDNPFGIGGLRMFDPHWTIELNDGNFLLFFQRRRYFYRIRPKDGVFDAVFPEDIWLPSEIDEFGATNYRNEDGSITFLVHETYGNRKKYSIYRSDPSFAKFEKIHTWHTRSGNIPHVLVPYRTGFLLSDFYYNDFHFKNDPAKTRVSEEALLKTVYRRLLGRFVHETRESEAVTDELFRKYVRIWTKGVVPVGEFKKYLSETYRASDCKGIKEYCDRSGTYAFDAFPGEVTYVDLTTGTECVFGTTCSNPAHFEIDFETGDAYVSSHNFNYLNRVVLEYFWPAAIDRFVWKDGGFEKAETFGVSEGYRFTSHRVMSTPSGKKVVTFGQPNRLYSVSVPGFATTEKIDVMTNRLEELSLDPDSLVRYLRREGGDESTVVKALEVSVDGSWTGFAVGSKEFFVFKTFPQLSFERFPIPFPESVDGEDGGDVFVSRTTHCNFV